MATHSIILAWRIPWAEKPGGLQSMGLQRIGVTNTFTFHKIDMFFQLGFLYLCKVSEDKSLVVFGKTLREVRGRVLLECKVTVAQRSWICH